MIEKTVFYSVCDDKGLSWNGQLPPKTSGKKGNLSGIISSWVPKFREEPKGWVRIETAMTKHRAYTLLRLVRPDLPELAVKRFEVRAVPVETIPSEIIDSDERDFFRLQMIFGSGIAADVFEFDARYHPTNHYLAPLGWHGRKEIKDAARTKLHTPLVGKACLILSDEDCVLIKMLHPAVDIYDLRKYLQPAGSGRED
jgi:hypothetical protein